MSRIAKYRSAPIQPRRYSLSLAIREEFGWENRGAEFTWTIDPIDGTQNLINRIPTFRIILGLLHKGQPIPGWIDHPVLGDSLRGGVGVGNFFNGTKVALNDIPESGLTPNDIIATNCPATFARGAHLSVLDAILRFHPHSRIYYDVYSHSLAIRGSLAVMVEYNLKIWDLSATKALTLGARGEFQELGSEGLTDGTNLFHIDSLCCVDELPYWRRRLKVRDVLRLHNVLD